MNNESRYTAETYTAALAGGASESGWCVKDGDDTICDVRTQEEAERVCALLNAPAVSAHGELPTDYRVTWEIDAFNATTPREAAEEARDAMTRANSTATVFTVYGRDGSVTDVDLSEDDDNV